jgi:hypothetical protein
VNGSGWKSGYGEFKINKCPRGESEVGTLNGRCPKNVSTKGFNYLAGAGVGRSGFKNAADARRGMGMKELDSLGNIKASLNRAQSLRGSLGCLA